MRRFLPLICSTTVGLLTGCAKDTEPVPAPVYLLDQRWVLVEIDGQAPSQQPGSSTTDLLLNAVGSNNTGQAACNRYGGSYLLNSGTSQLSFSTQFATYATCASQNLETRYFQLLPQVTRYTISNRRLALYDAEHSQPVLVFRAAE